MLAGIALVLHAHTGGASLHLIMALAALVAMGVAGYILRRPWEGGALVFLATSAAYVLSAGVAQLPAAVVLAVVVGGLTAVTGFLSHRSVRGELAAVDGIVAVLLMLLLSLGLTVLSGVSGQALQNESARLVVLIYLLTPPLEVAAVAAILLHKDLWRRFLERNYHWRRGLSRQVAEGFMWGIGIIMLTAVLVSLESNSLHMPVQPNNPFVYSPAVQKTPWELALVIALAVVVMAPLAEEALFRGLLYGGIRKTFGRWPAALVSALIFGAAHMNASLLLPLAVAGLILAMIYERSDSLWPSTVAHATLNGVSVLLALLIR
jgi:membrane protease YdiL (CAAX protease family)